jgi:hypothetical protein
VSTASCGKRRTAHGVAGRGARAWSITGRGASPRLCHTHRHARATRIATPVSSAAGRPRKACRHASIAYRYASSRVATPASRIATPHPVSLRQRRVSLRLIPCRYARVAYRYAPSRVATPHPVSLRPHRVSLRLIATPVSARALPQMRTTRYSNIEIIILTLK